LKKSEGAVARGTWRTIKSRQGVIIGRMKKKRASPREKKGKGGKVGKKELWVKEVKQTAGGKGEFLIVKEKRK